MIVLTKIGEGVKNFHLHYKEDPNHLIKVELVVQDLKKEYKKSAKSKIDLDNFNNIVKLLKEKSNLKNIDLKKP